MFVTLRGKYPFSYWAKKAVKELENTGQSSRIEYPAVPVSELLDIYDPDIEKSSSTPNLRDLLKKLDKIKRLTRGKLRSRINLMYGKIYFSMDSENSVKTSLAYLDAAFGSSDIEIKTQAAYYLARILGKDFRFARLKQIAVSIDTPRYRSSKYFERAVYAAGYPFMRKKKFKEALFFYNMILKNAVSKKEASVVDNSYYEQSLWRIHWCFYNLGQYDNALKILDEMGKYENWEEYAPYWKAYIYMKKGETEAAKNLYEKLVADSGVTYYGLLARDELKNRFGISTEPGTGKEKFEEFKMETISDITRETRFNILKETGLYEFAAEELEAYLREKGISMDTTKEQWKPYGSELAKLYFYSGKYLLSGVYLFKAYEKYISKGASEIPQWFWKIYYPVFYKDTIDTYSKTYKLDRFMVYSLIRQESVFEPFVVSGSGAIGVMQIMPETGKQVFKDMGSISGVKEFSTDLLYDPEFNIPMGIYHLKYQLYDRIDKFIKEKGIDAANNESMKEILTTAGYNAGIERSTRWITEIPFSNEQEFIDQIDITETRRYVKLVKKHYYFYKGLHPKH
jgi:soluble lytic murein transglycosylase